jgi:hypothetical protein
MYKTSYLLAGPACLWCLCWREHFCLFKITFLHAQIIEFPYFFFFCLQDTFKCKWQGHSVTHPLVDNRTQTQSKLQQTPSFGVLNWRDWWGKRVKVEVYLCKGDFTGFSPVKDGSTWEWPHWDDLGFIYPSCRNATNSPSFENFCRNQECSNRVLHTLYHTSLRMRSRPVQESKA